MPNQTVKNGLKAKKIKLPQMNFFSRKSTNEIFMYLLAEQIQKLCDIFYFFLVFYEKDDNSGLLISKPLKF